LRECHRFVDGASERLVGARDCSAVSIDAVKHGEEAAMRDLRELKLSLGDSRKIINQLKIDNQEGRR